jgi:polyhydroxyalkanoate synthase subunit PhaC
MVDEILGGDSRFILSTSGHIAAIVNPPATRRPATAWETRSSRTPGNGCRRPVPEQGSWWDDYVGWLTERGSPQKPSPAELGTTWLAPLVGAPSTYISES